MKKWLLLILFPFSVHAKTIAVPCVEFVAITGEQIPCHAIPILKMSEAQYQAAVRAKEERECKKAVRAKYKDDPCQPIQLWSTEEEAGKCSAELIACEKRAPSKPGPKPTVKLWD